MMVVSEDMIREALEGKFTYYVGRPQYTEEQVKKREQSHRNAMEEARKREAARVEEARRAYERACEKASRENAAANEPDYRQIIAAVALAHKLSVNDLLSTSRVNPIKFARHHAVWELRQRKPSFSLGKIGQHVGRDHTTVLNSLDFFKHNGHRFAAQVEMVERLLGKENSGKGVCDSSAAHPSQPQVD